MSYKHIKKLIQYNVLNSSANDLQNLVLCSNIRAEKTWYKRLHREFKYNDFLFMRFCHRLFFVATGFNAVNLTGPICLVGFKNNVFKNSERIKTFHNTFSYITLFERCRWTSKEMQLALCDLSFTRHIRLGSATILFLLCFLKIIL